MRKTTLTKPQKKKAARILKASNKRKASGRKKAIEKYYNDNPDKAAAYLDRQMLNTNSFLASL